MKNMFNGIVVVSSIIIGFAIWWFILGSPSGFKDGVGRHDPLPGSTMATIHTGGPLVAVLIGLFIVVVTFVIERFLSINKARGSGDPSGFLKNVQGHLLSGDINSAISSCDGQRGSLANIVRSGLDRYQVVQEDKELDAEKKLSEVQRAIDEATNLETPLLEKNMVMLSTVATIATMIGLTGTTWGMIRAFAALGAGGAVSAQQLSTGISEALWNTLLGLATAIVAIVFFNFFTTKIDNFIYMIDEAILSMMEILNVKVKK